MVAHIIATIQKLIFDVGCGLRVALYSLLEGREIVPCHLLSLVLASSQSRSGD